MGSGTSWVAPAPPRSTAPDAGGASVSVLIPTHSDAHLLRKSLPTLLRHPHDIEILVLNNDPSQDVAGGNRRPRGDERVRIVEMG